jgi:hypothetical protein
MLAWCRRLAGAYGWLSYHAHDSRTADPGFPDLVLLHPRAGRLLFRELKTAAGRLSPEQTQWRYALLAAGADYAIWRPADLVGETVSEQLRT